MTHREHMKKCELAKYVWKLKDENKTFDIKWSILKKVRGKLVGGACRLCTSERLLINEYPDKENLLNSNNVEKCRHREQSLLSIMKEPSDRDREREADTGD